MERLIREAVRPYTKSVVVAVFFMGLTAAATAFSAWLLKPAVNDVFIARDETMLWLVSGAVVLTFLVKGAATYTQSVIMSFVGMRIIADLQNRLYVHLSTMDISFFHNNPTGTLQSRFLIDITAMRATVSNAITSLGKDLLALVGLVAVMFIQNWELALISFFIFPTAVYPISRLGRRIRRVTANTQHEMGLFSTLLEQTFQGIRVVKAYCMETYEQERIGDIVQRVFQLSFRSARIRALSHPIMESLGGLAVAIVISYGGYQVIAGHTDTGSLFSFIAALLLAYEPMKRLANLNASLQEGLAGAQRLFDILDVEPTIRETEDAAELKVDKGGIRLETVRFSYVPGRPALDGIDLDIPAGSSVALVGPSGAGKTTVLNMIPRFHDVDSGRILIDGTDVRNVTLASLRANTALVSQEVMLFDNTVRANIAYGRIGASEEDIIAAAKNAAAHDFILELPDGYDTMVGELGAKLSGGQRQRLAIARAMLKDAPILLLDEATSALDTESERQVQAALDKLMRGRTTLVIAHRLSTIVNSDRICVIEDGKILESGTHGELVERDGMYARLYAMQFAEEEPAQETP
jgi:ATP-binding cassette, subfamily B, bacterial MsbA